ncbi:DUF2867 domain-containing protein [Bradyrhizobium lupini]
MTKARAVPMPSNSVLAPLYAGADLLDAFAIQLPAGASDDVEVLARAALERQAWWIRALTRVRDVVMAAVAVKSSRAVGLAAAARGPVIGFFPVLSKSATELVVGADDRHLDFRVTIQLRADAANGRELVAGTVVHCHNRLGRDLSCYDSTVSSRDRSGQFGTGGKSNEELSRLGGRDRLRSTNESASGPSADLPRNLSRTACDPKRT